VTDVPRGSAAGAGPEGFVSWKAGEDEALASQRFGNLLTAVGENGCGWEMPLEAWYRFVVEPFPYAGLTRVECPGSTSGGANCVQPATAGDGTLLLDQPLLAQRAAFLRPDSRLGIVMLTDENDCSLAIGAQGWVVLAIDDARPFFRGSSACDANPNDACCYSCPLGTPEGCAEDPVCDGDPASDVLPNRLPASADGANLRCFDQKRRFGVDFLYPVARYVNALTQPTLCPFAYDLSVDGCSGPLQPNPLFAGGRRASDVFVAGIVGVPWQLFQAQQNVPGRPAVENGFHYKLASELTLRQNALYGFEALSSHPPRRRRAVGYALDSRSTAPALRASSFSTGAALMLRRISWCGAACVLVMSYCAPAGERAAQHVAVE
jgi:hypothetical protein